MQGGTFGSSKKQLIPENELTKIISNDEAKSIVDTLNSINDKTNETWDSTDSYLTFLKGKGRGYVTDYVKANQNQVYITEDVIQASKDARAAQIAQNEAVKEGTLSFKAGQVALKGLVMAGNMVTMWLTSKALEGVVELITYSDKLANKAQEMGATFKDSKSDIESYKKQIDELKSTINDSSSSYDDVVQARKELLEIQDALINKYGDEETAIRNITDAIKDQTSELDNLTEKQYQRMINNFNETDWVGSIQNNFKGSNFQQMLDAMENGEYKVTFTVTGDSDFNKLLMDKYGAELTGDRDMMLVGNLQDVYDKLLEIQQLSKQYDTGNFFDQLSSSINEASDNLDKYEDIYNAYILHDKVLASDSEYADYYKKAGDAYKEYVSTVEKEGIDSDTAKANAEEYTKIISEVLQKAETEGETGVYDFFNTLHSDLTEETNKWNFKIKVTPTIDGESNISYDKEFESEIKDALSYFDNAEDLINFDSNKSADSDKKQAYNDLVTIARENFSGDVEALVDAAVEMYYVQTQAEQDLLKRIMPYASSNGSYEDAYATESNKDAIYDWVEKLTEDEKKLANSKEFENALEEQKKKLGEVAISAIECQIALQKVKDSQKGTISESQKSNVEILSQIQLLSEGLDQLEKIYQDVLDEEDFDWSNILNNDKFTETFGNMENVTREYKNAYTDFIKTVSNSPNDIKGCQEAFNKLATAYINDSDALKNVTEETRDSVVNMLKDMNIVNADELVDSRLAERTLEAKTATVDFVNATKDELSSLIDYANQLGLTSAEVAQLCLDQIDVTNNPIDASASLKNLQTLILKAGVTGEKLGYLLKMVRAINTVTLAVQDGTATDSQITAAERLVDTLKSKMAEVSTANIEAEVDYKPKAKETKSKSDSEKDFDWIERKIKALESQISSLDKIIDSAYSSTTEKNNALIKQIDLINQEIELQQKAYEGYMAKANAVTLSDNYKKLVQNGSIDIETITDKDLQEAISNYQSYYDSAQECLDKINELHENALDKHVECHDNELSDLKDMLDNQSITEKQYIDEMYRLWEKYYDGQVELAEKAKQQKLEILNEEKSWLESVGNAAIALLDDQVDKLEDQKDKATKIYQDQIDVLNAQKKPLEYELELMERQKDAADKQLQYQKALYALRRAEQQRQNYTYTSDKGFIYKADDQTIKDAKKDVSDAEYELLKLNIQQQIDAIDDQIDHLNDLIDQTEKYYDTQIDGLNAYKEEWQKAIDMEELATNMQTFIDKFGADGLQRLFNEDMSLITNWKQSYLDNMAEIDMESTGTIGNLTKKFEELSGLAISPTITAMADFEQIGTDAANAIANSLAGEEGSLSTAITDVNSKINGGGGSDNKEQSANGEQGQGGQTQDSGSDNLVGAMGELSDTALNEDTGIPAQTQAWTNMLDPLQEVFDKLNDIELTLENLNGKTFSINVEFKSSGASGSANANGNFTGAVIRSGAAFASGTLGASKDETALLGELGNELVVRGNRFFTVGNNGAEMFNVKKGDIIFNHQQTKDLLDKGCAMGHGVAYAEGNAGRVTMTAGIRPFRSGDPTYDMMQQFKACYSNNVDALNLNTNALNQRHEDFMRHVQNISNSVVNRQQTDTINIGDIHVTGVQDATGLARAIKTQLPNALLQEMHRR